MNKKNRSGLMKAVCAALIAIMMAGCQVHGGRSLPSGENVRENAVKSITLAVQDDVDPDRLEALIDRFEAENPEVKVELLHLPRERYDDMLHMMMTSGEGPDLFQASTEWLTTYMFKNWLLDLSEMVDKQLLRDYPKWAIDYTKDHNRFYAIPSEMMTLRLIYNKELFTMAGLDPNQPPATLQELAKYASMISKAGTGYRIYGFAFPGGENSSFQQALEMSSTYSGIYHYDYTSGEYDFSVYSRWFDTMLAMKQAGGMFPGETSLNMDTALTQFAEGNVGMMYVTSREYAQLNRMRTVESPESRVGVSMPPLYEASKERGGALMVSLQPPIAIHAYTEHKPEAAKLWQLMHSSEYVGSLFMQGDTIPISDFILGNKNYRPNMDQFEAFLPGTEESPYPKEPKFILQNQLQSKNENPVNAFRTKMYKEIMLGVTPVESALQLLSEQYNQSLDNAVYRNLINKNDYIHPDYDPLFPMKQKP